MSRSIPPPMYTFADVFAAYRRSWRQVWDNPHIRAVLLVFALLSALDLITTYADLHAGCIEGNPVFALLFAHFPFVVGALLKVIGTVFVAAVATGIYSLDSRVSLRLLTLCTLVLTAVVVWNIMPLVSSAPC